MVGPAGTLTLLIATASPFGPSDYAWVSDATAQPQAAQYQQTTAGRGSEFSWATDHATAQQVGYVSADLGRTPGGAVQASNHGGKDAEAVSRAYHATLAGAVLSGGSPVLGRTPRTMPQATDGEAPPAPLTDDPAYPSNAAQSLTGDSDTEQSMHSSAAEDAMWLGEWEGDCCDGGGCGHCRDCSRESRGWLGGICIESWISQGFTVNTDFPIDRLNSPVGFNDTANDYQMNQLYVALERAVDDTGSQWDIGGRVDLIYGTDSFYTTARGLETRRDFSQKWNTLRYGLSMPQLYMEVGAPWADGVTMKLGHFYTLLGYETIPTIDNFFYSKSYAMLYGEPFTHTGFLGSARFGDLVFHGGMTRGWDNWEDNNNDFSFLGGMNWSSRDGRTSLAYAIHFGREQADPSTDIRSTFSFVVQHKFTDRSRYVVQYDRGYEENGASNGSDADWFGVNQYLLYTINCQWQAGARFEWFRDEEGTRVQSQGADYFNLTLGLNWMPNEAVTFRPEFRWDWVDNRGVRPYVDGTRHDQILLACDVIIAF